jgi:hypothetical protein
MMIGVYGGQNSSLSQASSAYVDQILEGNAYLRQQGGFARTTIGGRQALKTTLSGRSSITGRTEIVDIYTSQFRNGQLFYAITVVPDTERFAYDNAFRNVLSSIRFND